MAIAAPPNLEPAMLDAAIKAFSQMLSPPFRAVLLKSAGLAAVLLIALAVALHRLIAWLTTSGGQWIEFTVGPAVQTPLNILLWVLAIVAALGLVIGAVFLMPAVTALVAGLFGDDIAAQVEASYY